MALQLRRGSDAERIAITFAEGELVYTTDTKKIWIGDGTTAGGLNVTAEVELSPSQLNKNLNLNNFTINGTGTIDITGDISTTGNLSVIGNITDVVDITITGNFNTTGSIASVADITASGTISGSFSGDGSLLTNLPINGNVYQIDVKATDDSTIVDSATKTFSGSFVGDGSQLTNLPIQPGGFINGATYNLTVSADDATVLVNSATKEFNTSGITITDNRIVNRSSNDLEIFSELFNNSTLTVSVPVGGSFRLNAYNGTYQNKTNTVPGNLLNNIRFGGHVDGSNKLVGGILSSWGSTADFNTANPASSVVIYAGNNTASPSTLMFNGLLGEAKANIFTTGSYANAADRDARISSPAAGMIIFVVDADGLGASKFQGYNGVQWVNF